MPEGEGRAVEEEKDKAREIGGGRARLRFSERLHSWAIPAAVDVASRGVHAVR